MRYNTRDSTHTAHLPPIPSVIPSIISDFVNVPLVSISMISNTSFRAASHASCVAYLQERKNVTREEEGEDEGEEEGEEEDE